MRRWTTWILAQAAFWGIAAGATHWHASEHPRRLAVVIDDSNPMHTQWARTLECARSATTGRRYHTYMVLTPKRILHPWSEQVPPTVGSALIPYGPRILDRALEHDALDQADDVLVVTNASTLPESAPKSWVSRRIEDCAE